MTKLHILKGFLMGMGLVVCCTLSATITPSGVASSSAHLSYSPLGSTVHDGSATCAVPQPFSSQPIADYQSGGVVRISNATATGYSPFGHIAQIGGSSYSASVQQPFSNSSPATGGPRRAANWEGNLDNENNLTDPVPVGDGLVYLLVLACVWVVRKKWIIDNV